MLIVHIFNIPETRFIIEKMLVLKVYKLVEILGEERQATRENVERKQARTSDELEEDDDADVAGHEDSDDEEEQVLYNPKNLPLGKIYK